MSYKQVRQFNKSKGGSKPGLCLQNVRMGYSIAANYPNAITAWRNTEQHRTRTIPKGVDVPLFYTYKTDGHINVRLSDGRIWNDGRIFNSLASFEKAWSNVGYLGWGESVNGVKVIKSDIVEDMYKGKSAKYWYEQYVKKSKERNSFLKIINKVKSAFKK